MEGNGRSLRGAFVAVTSLFFMWGFITVLVDALIPRLKEVFELTFLQAGLVQFAWFAAYGLLSIPGGNLISKLGCVGAQLLEAHRRRHRLARRKSAHRRTHHQLVSRRSHPKQGWLRAHQERPGTIGLCTLETRSR